MKPVRERPGFTLIELLIVVGIIAVLMGIAIAVGMRVGDSGKVKSTKDLLLALDNIYTAAQSGNAGKVLPPTVADPRLFTNRNDPAATLWIPIADARVKSGQNGGDELILNSAALFLWQARQYPEAAKLIESLPTKLVKVIDPDDPETQSGASANESNVVGQPQLATPIDAWGNPIRYVHPAFDGLIQRNGQVNGWSPLAPQFVPDLVPPSRYLFGEIRRNAFKLPDTSPTVPSLPADSDGGTCVGGRPYFYSLGPDGKAGLEKLPDGSIRDNNVDNVYSVQPTLPSKP